MGINQNQKDESNRKILVSNSTTMVVGLLLYTSYYVLDVESFQTLLS